MTSSGAIRVRGYSWIKILLFTCALLPLAAVPVRAQSVGGCVANFGAENSVQALTITYPIDFLPAT